VLVKRETEFWTPWGAFIRITPPAGTHEGIHTIGSTA
jgi:hypothetical protein